MGTGGFVCPECLLPGGLGIVLHFELPPDGRSDEITVQLVACSNCPFQGVAVYEESRRGALDSESWEHTGYRFDTRALAELSDLMRSCPGPGDRRCVCPAHRALDRNGDGNRWDGWTPRGALSFFPMRAARDGR